MKSFDYISYKDLEWHKFIIELRTETFKTNRDEISVDLKNLSNKSDCNV